MTTTLNYSTTYINMNFRIKAYGINNEGKKINTLVGVSGALDLIGAELLNKFIERAQKAGNDSCVCKLRRGLVITLYIK